MNNFGMPRKGIVQIVGVGFYVALGGAVVLELLSPFLITHLGTDGIPL